MGRVLPGFSAEALVLSRKIYYDGDVCGLVRLEREAVRTVEWS
jgi:hypothetical protein